jgi:hypothetical protein
MLPTGLPAGGTPDTAEKQGEAMPDISPEPLMDSVMGHLRTSAIKAAIELDVFSAIAEGAADAAAIGKRTGAAERGIQALADYLTVMGFLDKADGRYRLTPSSAVFLDRRSPAFLGDIHRFLAAPEMLAVPRRPGGLRAQRRVDRPRQYGAGRPGLGRIRPTYGAS